MGHDGGGRDCEQLGQQVLKYAGPNRARSFFILLYPVHILALMRKL
jgi:hypothetical protein